MGPVDPSVENPRKNTDSHTVNSVLMDTPIIIIIIDTYIARYPLIAQSAVQ